MLQRIDLRAGLGSLRGVLPRAAVDIGGAVASVGPLIQDVRDRGAAAVLDAAERFDGIRPERLRVPAEVIAAAADVVTPAVRAALIESIARARVGHAAQLPTGRVTTIAPGGTVTQRWVPVRRVGLYVPGGLALYPSSVVMNVVPAQVAGVRAIAVTSPPQRDNGGWPDRNVLAACSLLGIDEVYSAGGAQGIALLALGAVDLDGTVIEPVDVVTGPGNVYVTAAKRLLRGTVAIDSEAGPTEIAVIADESADPVHVAADLISQAEHDPLAASVLITTSDRARRRSRYPAAAAGLDHQALRAGAGSPVRQTVRCGTRRFAGRCDRGRRRLRGRAPGDPDPGRGNGCRPDQQRRRGVRRARSRRSRSATTARGRTTCCRPAVRRGIPPACPR